MRFRTLTVIALAALAVACGDKQDKPAEAPKLAEDAAPVAKPEPADAGAPVMNHGNWDELVKPPKSARLTSGPKAHGTGDRMQAAYCLQKVKTAKAAAEAFEAALKQTGWEDIVITAQPETPDRGAVAGNLDPYRIAITLRRAELADCKASEGNTFAAVVLQRVGPAPTEAP